MLSEAKFSTVEDELGSLKFTNQLKKLINNFRHANLHIRGGTNQMSKAEAERTLRDRVHREKKIHLGELSVGRKKIDIWIEDIAGVNKGYYLEPPKHHKKRTSIALSLNYILHDSQATLSALVHEILHELQIDKRQSERYSELAGKTEDLTPSEWFDYYTEPRELEAQLGELSHNVVMTFNSTKNKEEFILRLREILKVPKEEFADIDWLSDSEYAKILRIKLHFLQTISEVPEDSQNAKRHQYLSNRSWHQFKQKLFNLMEVLKSKI